MDRGGPRSVDPLAGSARVPIPPDPGAGRIGASVVIWEGINPAPDSGLSPYVRCNVTILRPPGVANPGRARIALSPSASPGPRLATKTFDCMANEASFVIPRGVAVLGVNVGGAAQLFADCQPQPCWETQPYQFTQFDTGTAPNGGNDAVEFPPQGALECWAQTQANGLFLELLELGVVLERIPLGPGVNLGMPIQVGPLAPGLGVRVDNPTGGNVVYTIRYRVEV